MPAKISSRIFISTFSLVAILVLVASAVFSDTGNKVRVVTLIIAGQKIYADVADTPSLRSKGLSGKKVLDTNNGMIFVFDEPGLYSFWMKDMLFSIDIIWFNENREVIDVWENAHPFSYPKSYAPEQMAKYVLEVSAGFSENFGIKNGDKLEFK